LAKSDYFSTFFYGRAQDCVAKVRKEIAAYKRFKALMEEWIDLGIESSKLRLKVDKKTG
jgi:hypothetical protein